MNTDNNNQVEGTTPSKKRAYNLNRYHRMKSAIHELGAERLATTILKELETSKDPRETIKKCLLEGCKRFTDETE